MVEVGHADFRLAGHLLTAMLLAALSGRAGLNKRQLTLSHGVDEGVVVADVDDDGRTNQASHRSMRQQFWVLMNLCSELSLNMSTMPAKERRGQFSLSNDGELLRGQQKGPAEFLPVK